MSDKLKPCPFCGGEVEIRHYQGGFYVACLNPDCVATYMTPDFESPDSAIADWNRRAGDD